MTKRHESPGLRVVTLHRGDLLTQKHVDALRDPERLVSSRHCRRRADGRLEARRSFTIALPAEPA
jgi:hypothetical protein